jgi:hypothetical protein
VPDKSRTLRGKLASQFQLITLIASIETTDPSDHSQIVPMSTKVSHNEAYVGLKMPSGIILIGHV